MAPCRDGSRHQTKINHNELDHIFICQRHENLTDDSGDGAGLRLIPARLRRASTGYVRVHRTSHMPAWVEGPSARRFVLPARAVVDTARRLNDLREVRALVGDAVQNAALGKITVEAAVAQIDDQLRFQVEMLKQ